MLIIAKKCRRIDDKTLLMLLYNANVFTQQSSLSFNVVVCLKETDFCLAVGGARI